MCARGWTPSRRPSTAIIVCGAISIRAARPRREPMRHPRGADPFTLEIIKDALVAIGDEMFVALQRTSKSPIIYEVLDYACGLTDTRGQNAGAGPRRDRIPGYAGAGRRRGAREVRGPAASGRYHHHQRSVRGWGDASIRRVVDPARVLPPAAGGVYGQQGTLDRAGRQGPGQLDDRRHRSLPGRPRLSMRQAV